MIVFVAGICLFNSGPVYGENLEGALTRLYAQHPRIFAERARQKANSERVPQAWGNFLPTASASVIAENDHINYFHNNTKARDNTGYMEFSVSQPLFSGLRYYNRLRSAQADVKAGSHLLRNAEQEIILDGITAYLAVIRGRLILKHRIKDAGLLAENVKAAIRRGKLGDLSRTDVSQARARYSESIANRELAHANMEASSAKYFAAMGESPPKTLTVPRLNSRALPRTLDEAVALSGNSNPGILAADLSERAARHSTKAAKGEFLPSISLDGTYRREYERKHWDRHEAETRVQLKLSVPLMQGGKRLSQVREAKYKAQQLRYEAEYARRSTRESTIRSWSQLRAAHARTKAAQETVKAAIASVKGLKVEFEVGQRSLIDVLDGQRELVNARIALVNSQYEARLAHYSLMALFGRLTPPNLGLQVSGTSRISTASIKSTRPVANFASRSNVSRSVKPAAKKDGTVKLTALPRRIPQELRKKIAVYNASRNKSIKNYVQALKSNRKAARGLLRKAISDIPDKTLEPALTAAKTTIASIPKLKAPSKKNFAARSQVKPIKKPARISPSAKRPVTTAYKAAIRKKTARKNFAAKKKTRMLTVAQRSRQTSLPMTIFVEKTAPDQIVTGSTKAARSKKPAS